MLALLPVHPVFGSDTLRAFGLGLEPAVHLPAQIVLLAQARSEGDVRQPAAEALQQRAQSAQALKLPGTEQPVSGGCPLRGDQPVSSAA